MERHINGRSQVLGLCSANKGVGRILPNHNVVLSVDVAREITAEGRWKSCFSHLCFVCQGDCNTKQL